MDVNTDVMHDGFMTVGVAEVELWTRSLGWFLSNRVVNHFILARILYPAHATTRLKAIRSRL